MQNRIFILSLIFIFSAGLFAGDAGDRKKSNGKSAATGKTNTSGELNIEGAAAGGISFVNANGDTLMQVREDGQVIIGAAVANGNAVLDVDALNNDKGVMLPRLTRAERFAMSLTPADEGLLVYDETNSRFWYWQGSQWEVVGNNVGDNLGDHTVRQTLNLNDYYLSGDGDSEGLYIDDDGNVGIGTTVPSERFHVNNGDVLISRTGSNSTGTSLTIEGRMRIKNDPIVSLDFKNSDADDSDVTYTAAAIRSFNNGGSDDGDLRLFTAADSILAERMRITDEGNVGIGTKTPGSELEVNGTITATSFVGDGSGLTGIAGDNLGTHTATQALDLANNNVANGDTITANVFLGDGSGLTGIAGDNLGSHTAIQTLDLADNNITNGDTVTANVFVGDGSGLTNLPAGNVWQLTGNTGTDSTVNFIGTTDDQPLFFKANNQTILRLYDHALAPNIIAGFSGNHISAGSKGVTISGGGNNANPNSVSSDYGTIGGGFRNTVTRDGAVIGGGRINTAGGFYATISGGSNNTAEDDYAAVGGGLHNMASGVTATVSGGNKNTASGSRSTVGGGRYNIASGTSATVAGGGGYFSGSLGNTASGDWSTIGGGRENTAKGSSATVPGGRQNNAAGNGSFAAGQRAKIADAHNGTFLYSDQSNFDFNSAASNEFAIRATGGMRFVTAIDASGNPVQTIHIDSTGTVSASAFVGDGSGLTGIAGDDLGSHTATQILDLANNNITNGDTVTANAFVGDGSGLTNLPFGNVWQLTGNTGTDSTVNFIGTTDDQPLFFKANNQTILRLYDGLESPNIIAGFSGNRFAEGVSGATISGGGNNLAPNSVIGDYGTIGGGLGNTASEPHATVSGGEENTAAFYATVSGGEENTASGGYATVSGGQENTASLLYATVSGGERNTASSLYATVGGGEANMASAYYTTVSGGEENTASGESATVPGGYQNTAAGQGSFAAGQHAKIADTHDGTFLFSDHSGFDFNSAAANEFAVRATGGVRFVTGIDGVGNSTQTVGINSNGNVGIGTATPGHRLHVKGTSIALTEGAQSLSLRTSEANGYVQLDVGGSGHSGDKIYIGDLTNNTNEVIMMGDVGIGMTNPANKLSVSGSADFSGKVGIGTSAPEKKLHIKSSGANDAKIIIEGDANDDPTIEFRDDAGTIGFIGWDNSENAIRITPDPYHYNSRGISINPEGNVGIGTTDPIRAKVEIQGHTGVLPLSYGWLNNTGNTGTASNGNGRYSLYASDRIAAVEFNAFSDERIKNIRGRSDSEQDLNTLLAVEITDYTMIDTVAKGSQFHKKVIAQQVKDVFPQAVSTMTDVVPDIYQLSEIADGWVQLATDLQVGEKVKLIRKDGSDIYAVQAVRDGAFRVDLAENGEVFVYGREVDDFHTVDYEAIAMLNVSATQELFQRMQQQQAAMNVQQKEIAALKEKVAKVDMLENQLAAIMQQLASSNAVRSAMLTGSNEAQ